MTKYVLPNRVIMTIDDSVLDGMFLPGGQVWGDTRDFGKMHLAEAKREAPFRTGELRMAHEMVMTPNRRRQCQYTVINFAEYAKAVALGTRGKGMIKSNKEFYLGETRGQRDKRAIMFKYFRHKGMPVRRWRELGRGSYRGLLRVRHAPSSYYGEDWLRKSVKGQEANNWIEHSFTIAYHAWVAKMRGHW